MLVPRRVCFSILFLELQVPGFFCLVHARKAPCTNDFLDAGVLSRSVSIVKGDLVFNWMQLFVY